MVGAGSSVVTTVCRVTSKRELGLSAGIRAPWTSDIIACNGRRWQEVDGTVFGGDRADIAVLIPDETVLVEGHREICTLGENDLWSVQRPCLQMYVDGGTASLDKIVMGNTCGGSRCRIPPRHRPQVREPMLPWPQRQQIMQKRNPSSCVCSNECYSDKRR